MCLHLAACTMFLDQWAAGHKYLLDIVLTHKRCPQALLPMKDYLFFLHCISILFLNVWLHMYADVHLPRNTGNRINLQYSSFSAGCCVNWLFWTPFQHTVSTHYFNTLFHTTKFPHFSIVLFNYIFILY